jgi:hypothetical protein
MSRNGSGTYSLPEAPFVYDTVISETAVNSNFSDMAAALTQSLSKDGQTTPSANLPMGGYRHTGVGNGAARNDYAAVGQIQDESVVWCGTAGGTANALTLTPSPAITAYATGQRFKFKAGASPSDDAVTIAVSGLTAKAAEIDNTALSATRVISAGKYYEILYDGTAFQVTRLSGVGIADLANGTDGELITWDTSGAPTTVAVGTSGQVLTSNGAGAAPTFQTISNTVDQVARDSAASAMAVANASGVAGGQGTFFLADPFTSDTLATKTNATYDATNDWYSNTSSAEDGNYDTGSAGTSTGWGGAQSGRGNIALQFTASSTGTVSSASFEASTVSQSMDVHAELWTDSAGSPGTQVGSDSATVSVTTSGEKVFTFPTPPSVTGSTLYWMVFVAENPAVGDVLTTTKAGSGSFGSGYSDTITSITDNGTAASAGEEYRISVTLDAFGGNMTLAPTAETLDTADPPDLMAYFLFIPVDSVTFGTDVIGKLSIDGNSTKATGAWTLVGSLSGGELWRLDADVSAQTGSSVSYEITTANSKVIKVKSCVGVEPLY